MPPFRNCIATILAILAATTAAAQTAATQPAPGDAEYTIFYRGTPIGREQAYLARTGDGWIITAAGRTAPPFENTLHRFQLKYSADWQPQELQIQSTAGRTSLTLATSFGGTTAVNEITRNGLTTSKTDQVSARTIVLPNNFYAGYEALAARLVRAGVGTELPIYIVPQAEAKLTIKSVREELLAIPGGKLATRRYEGILDSSPAGHSVRIAIDDRARFVRLEVPASGLVVVRTDLAGVATRSLTARNPTDNDVFIPGNGFNIAATVTTPVATAPRLRHPAVVLVPGSGLVDREGTVGGIPLFAQLAGALAQRGFLVLRYDKRGIGQSGGRIETATLQDSAEDLISVVKWLRKRKDVDDKRVSVAGFSEGGWTALVAASREKRIASVILMGTGGTTGADLILEQQQYALDRMKTPADERQKKIELQKRIHSAVLTGEGWDGIPEDVRLQADTPWFESLLSFDPAGTIKKVKQPILIIHGSLDKEVPQHHAARLGELARARKKAPPTEIKQLPGINHLLVRATSGDVSEYSSLKGAAVAPAVSEAIAAWASK